MAFEAQFGLPDGVPTLASALETDSKKEKHIIKNFKGVDSVIIPFNPTTSFSMTVEAIDSTIVPGDGSTLGIPGLPEGGYTSLDSVKRQFKADGNAQQVHEGVVHPNGTVMAPGT